MQVTTNGEPIVAFAAEDAAAVAVVLVENVDATLAIDTLLAMRSKSTPPPSSEA